MQTSQGSYSWEVYSVSVHGIISKGDREDIYSIWPIKSEREVAHQIREGRDGQKHAE